MVGANVTSGSQCLPRWADVDVAFLVKDEVGARERAIFALTLIPYWNVRRDLLGYQPAEKPPRAIAVSAASRLGLIAKRCSVRSIIVLVAATSS